MTVICTSLHFEGAPAITMVLILLNILILQMSSQLRHWFRIYEVHFFRNILIFVGDSREVGSNWMPDCSWKPSKLLLPPFEGTSTMNGDPLVSNTSASNGAYICNGVGEKMVTNKVEEIWKTSCIVVVDNFLHG